MLKKSFLIALGFMVTALFAVNNASADTSAIFDLNQSGSQTQTMIGSNGQEQQLTVSDDTNSLLRVANGTKTISWNVGIARASFKISVSGNKITRAYDGTYTFYTASVKSAKLSRDSNKQATYRFTFGTPIWDFGGWNGWLRANINSSNKLVVTTK